MKYTITLLFLLLTGILFFSGCAKPVYPPLPAIPQYPENNKKYDLSSTIAVLPYKDGRIFSAFTKNLAEKGYKDIVTGTHYKARFPENVRIITIMHSSVEILPQADGQWLDAHLIVSVRKPGIVWAGEMRYETPRYFQASALYFLKEGETSMTSTPYVQEQVVKNLFTIDAFRQSLESAVAAKREMDTAVPYTPEYLWKISGKYQAAACRNDHEAVRWAYMAYMAGSTEAGKYLAVHTLFSNVYGDHKRLFMIVKELALKGNALAANRLGMLYANGNGTSSDAKQAFYWYNQSAAKGFSPAQYSVGRCYENGYGVEKNISRAIHYYRLAAAQNHSLAKQKLKDLLKKK